jgi:hypothetical protein
VAYVYKMKNYLVILFLCSIFSCSKDEALPKNYKAKKVVLIIIDGVRNIDLYNDTLTNYTQDFFNLIQQGTYIKNFSNNGITNTLNGCTALSTGNYVAINNGGAELPTYESFLQKWMSTYNIPKTKAWVIASKDKSNVLGKCKSCSIEASTNCGVAGAFTGYRNDSTTQQIAKSIFNSYLPYATIVHYKEPDASGHAADWQAYLNGIKASFAYAQELVTELSNNNYYKNETAIFITTDHGRHLDAVADGFVSHGDNCAGCKNIFLIAIGPDFEPNKIINTNYEQIDVPQTINTMFRLNMKNVKGKNITELL